MTWVILETFNNRPEAELVKALLEQLGIEAMITADDAGGFHPQLALRGGVKLLVQDSAATRARQALSDLEEDPDETKG